jgi:hypothetical protein
MEVPAGWRDGSTVLVRIGQIPAQSHIRIPCEQLIEEFRSHGRRVRNPVTEVKRVLEERIEKVVSINGR